MTHSAIGALRRLASPPRPARPRTRAGAVLLLRLACAALLGQIGYIHLHLWLEGYRQLPVNGPLFLLDAISAFALAALLLAWPRPLAGLAAAGFTASTLGALLISLSVGLFGFRESISASDVKASIVVETVATAGLLGWAILAAAPRPGGRAPGLLPRHAVTGPDNGDRRFRLPGWRHR